MVAVLNDAKSYVPTGLNVSSSLHSFDRANDGKRNKQKGKAKGIGKGKVTAKATDDMEIDVKEDDSSVEEGGNASDEELCFFCLRGDVLMRYRCLLLMKAIFF